MSTPKEDRPPEKVCHVDDCGAWRTGESEYCHHHQGLGQTTGAPEGNQNATTHGLYALPENLKEHFSDRQRDRYHAYFEALCTRYEHRLGHKPDAFAKDRLSRVAIECVKERIADEYFAEKADESGNLLIEETFISGEDGAVQVEQSNQLLKELTALKRETRLTLKDMGLLSDPESQQADATEDLAAMFQEQLE